MARAACARLAGLVAGIAAIATARADVTVLPAADAKHPVDAPLLVVLHGDRETAAMAAKRWQAAVKQRGWALLALDCPKAEGCTNKDHSWWQWNGDPAYVVAQVDQLVAAAATRGVRIDTRRIALAGWSGGGSYLGRRAHAWTRLAAALVIHGGGMPTDEATCPDRALPAYFLVGDRNPLHALAVALREYFTGCQQDVVWDLVRRGDHDREDRALTTKKALAILDWVADHARAK